MARPLRIEYPGAVYPVTSWGNERRDVFFTEDDRRGFLGVLAEVCKRFDWVCHAYCLMSNHYHLLMETQHANLSKGMRQLNGVYTQQINRRHGRVGHLFQGRFQGILVEKDSYLLELARYIVVNPVRAGTVDRAEDWAWRVTYLGSERFVEQMQARIGPNRTLEEMPLKQKRPLAYYAEHYEEHDQAMAEAYRSGAYSMREVGVYFGAGRMTVSRAVKKHEISHNKPYVRWET